MRRSTVFRAAIATVATVVPMFLPVAVASAALLPATTLYFHSANGGYSEDFEASPGGAGNGGAPIGSTLSTAAPTGTDTALARYAGAQNAGLPGVPTFSLPTLPAASNASSVCLDIWLSNAPNVAIGGGVLSRFSKPATTPGGSPLYANSVLDPGVAGQLNPPVHIRGRVTTLNSTFDLNGLVFSIYGYSNSNTGFTLHYDSVAYPSFIEINPALGTCPLPAVTNLGGTSPNVVPPTYNDYVIGRGLPGNGALYNGSGQYCAEPSIGVNWKTNNALIICGPYTLRARWNDTTSPPTATIQDASPPFPGFASFDPILNVDPLTGRVFNSQLLLATSETLFSDDDGATWQPSQGSGQPHGVDHQTIGSGPMHASVNPLPGTDYGRRSVFYCSQSIVAGLCAQSLDGGQTFGATTPTYSIAQCGGLHGHVQVGPAGEAYLPNRNCGGGPAISRSLDGNRTWSVHPVPGGVAQPGSSDPGLAVGSAGALYLGYEGSNGQPTVTVSRNKGDNWSTPVDVGVPFGIQNTQFTTMVAGDDDRAAFAFLGTTTPGDDQAAAFTGVWHLYVSTTYDHGRTWTTVKADPTNIAQRGCIWLGGGDNPCRNMLDFMDVTVDRQGRVLVGWADGCFISTCQASTGTNALSRDSEGTITRQSSGLGLFRTLDGFTPTDPDAVVPEIPYGVLLPLIALALMGTAYQVVRRRSAA